MNIGRLHERQAVPWSHMQPVENFPCSQTRERPHKCSSHNSIFHRDSSILGRPDLHISRIFSKLHCYRTDTVKVTSMLLKSYGARIGEKGTSDSSVRRQYQSTGEAQPAAKVDCHTEMLWGSPTEAL